MMFFLAASVLLIAVLGFVFLVRPADLPPPVPVRPDEHLQTRKAQIYENLRDLAFEYRVGKLSGEDYQRTKQGLQGELAGVLSEIDEIQKLEAAPVPAPAKTGSKAKKSDSQVCRHCGARFDRALRFCGECGKAMS